MRLFKHLKQIVSIVALGVALIFIISYAYFQSQNPQIAQTSNTFTWEGELDPNEFDNWKIVGTQPTPKGNIWVFMKNPDLVSPIKIVSIAVDRDKNVLSYCYFKNGNPYSYFFDSGENKYKQHHFTQGERKSCMRCHQDKIIPWQEV